MMHRHPPAEPHDLLMEALLGLKEEHWSKVEEACRVLKLVVLPRTVACRVQKLVVLLRQVAFLVVQGERPCQDGEESLVHCSFDHLVVEQQGMLQSLGAGSRRLMAEQQT